MVDGYSSSIVSCKYMRLKSIKCTGNNKTSGEHNHTMHSDIMQTGTVHNDDM